MYFKYVVGNDDAQHSCLGMKNHCNKGEVILHAI